ncbi:DUF5677 domain-containing protein [Cellulomonas timonensis]|uniref:DUF5677 domain-containing protein n=1 Tax=Cellulomonas timonensis TaxID=1689271 RepID=UPI000832127C|nr:DUF5677 domain-containing protein [Cellulomonas timonensis]
MADIELQSALRSLIADWNSATTTGSIGMGRRDHMLIGLTVYGLTAQVYHLAEAALVLDEHGLDQAAIPLVRQAIECAITAVWLERSGYPEVLSLIREQTRQQRNAIEEFVKVGAKFDDPTAQQRVAAELDGLLRTQTPAGEKFAARCDELAGANAYYALYRVASSTSHASTAVVDRYLEGAHLDEDAPAGIALLGRPEVAEDETLGGVSNMLDMGVLATSAWSRIDKRHTARTAMKHLCRVLEIPYRMELTAHGLAQQREREIEYKVWSQEQRSKAAGAAD